MKTLSSSPDPVVTPFSADLHAALAHGMEASRVLIATDFDGTIAPFHHDPQAARALPAAAQALEDLAGLTNTNVAVVSGRPLNVLQQLLGDTAQRCDLIASHGAEHRYLHPVPDAAPAAEDEAITPLRDALVRDLTSITAAHPGTFVEIKPHGAALHTRPASPTDRVEATAQALALAPAYPAAHLLTGNNVVEYSTSPATKGAALTPLATSRRADTVVYLGDDVTDETAFAALAAFPGAITIKVGAGPTAAQYRVADVDESCGVLTLLATTRAAHAPHRKDGEPTTNWG